MISTREIKSPNHLMHDAWCFRIVKGVWWFCSNEWNEKEKHSKRLGYTSGQACFISFKQQIALAAHHIIYMFSERSVVTTSVMAVIDGNLTAKSSFAANKFHYMARLSQPWVCERCAMPSVSSVGIRMSQLNTIISNMQSMAR